MSSKKIIFPFLTVYMGNYAFKGIKYPQTQNNEPKILSG